MTDAAKLVKDRTPVVSQSSSVWAEKLMSCQKSAHGVEKEEALPTLLFPSAISFPLTCADTGLPCMADLPCIFLLAARSTKWLALAMRGPARSARCISPILSTERKGGAHNFQLCGWRRGLQKHQAFLQLVASWCLKRSAREVKSGSEWGVAGKLGLSACF